MIFYPPSTIKLVDLVFKVIYLYTYTCVQTFSFPAVLNKCFIIYRCRFSMPFHFLPFDCWTCRCSWCQNHAHTRSLARAHTRTGAPRHRLHFFLRLIVPSAGIFHSRAVCRPQIRPTSISRSLSPDGRIDGRAWPCVCASSCRTREREDGNLLSTVK